jgi:hypothetical protein
VLSGLGHDRVRGRHDKNGAIHLRGAGDHVLDVVGVTRAVDVRIVTLVGLILKVPRADGDTARLLFRRIVDVFVLEHLVAELAPAVHGDGRTQRRLAMVDVSDGTNVHMRFGTLEFFFGHINLLLGFVNGTPQRFTT